MFMQNDDEVLSKKKIDSWLKETGRDRKWLAEKCLVKQGQCYNWFSKNGNIPRAKLDLIEKLMNGEKHAPSREVIPFPILNGVASVPVLLDEEQLEVITWAANEIGMRVEDFIKDAALKDAAASFGEIGKKNRSQMESGVSGSQSCINFQEFGSAYIVGQGAGSGVSVPDVDTARKDC